LEVGPNVSSFLCVPISVDTATRVITFGRGAETESDSGATLFGGGVTIFALLAATYAWHMVMGKLPFAQQELSTICAFAGGAFVWLLLGDGFVARLSGIAVVASAFISGKTIAQRLDARAAREAIGPA
jgi:hypothetical protein